MKMTKVQVQEVYGIGDEVDWELNSGGRIRDRIKAIEPASYFSGRARLSPIMLAVSKVYFDKNPDSPYPLGTFKDFKRMGLRQKNSQLLIFLRRAA